MAFEELKNRVAALVNDQLEKIEAAVLKATDGAADVDIHHSPDESLRAINTRVSELLKLTDDEVASVIPRALAIYLAAAKHIKAGGYVWFVNPDFTKRTLKIRLRK